MTALLALSGWQGAGKDVLGAAVLEGLGRPWRREAFGDEVIRVARTILEGGSPLATMPTDLRSLLEGAAPDIWSGHRSEKSRFALQSLGVWQRAVDPDVFVRSTRARVTASMANGFSVLVPDLRTLREATVMREAGAVLVRVDVSRSVQNERLAARGVRVGASRHHELETELDDWDGFDLRVENSGSSEAGTWKALTALREFASA